MDNIEKETEVLDLETNEIENDVVETKDNTEVEETITMTKKEYQAKIDSISDKKVHSVATSKNDEIARLKTQLEDVKRLSSEEFKTKFLEESTKELENSFSEREKELLEKEQEFKKLVVEHEKLVSIQSTNKLLESVNLPKSLAEELVNTYGTDIEKINERVLSIKKDVDDTYRKEMIKKVATKNPKIQQSKNSSDDLTGLSTIDLINKLKNNKRGN